MVDETLPNDAVRGACTTCHAIGRALSWRRSQDDWRLLTNMHVALYAQAEAAFRRDPNAPRGAAAGPGAATQTAPAGPPVQPVEEALTFLGKNAALHTPEWAAWQARMRAPKLAGRWLVSATIPGKGKYIGEMVLEPGAAEDEFATRVKLTSVNDGSTLTRSGQGLVYAGYSWRGRSKGTASGGSTPDDFSSDMREAMRDLVGSIASRGTLVLGRLSGVWSRRQAATRFGRADPDGCRS